MQALKKEDSKEVVQKKVNAISLATVTKLPTSFIPTEIAWKITTPMISCGLRQLQGWSSGVGISGNENLEEKIFLLTYFSKHRAKYTGEKWMYKSAPGLQIAPIGVGGNFWQFLDPNQNYVVSSNVDWVDRLERCIAKYDLGNFTRTNGFKNPNWHKGNICVAVWTWNGNTPPASDFNYLEA
jgi:hypothetical protein